MKRLILAGVVVAAVGLAGCKEGSSVAPSTNPNRPQDARKLDIKSPGSQTITQDATDEMTISIDRHNFQGPITIGLDSATLPKGISVVTKELTIPEGKDSLTLTIKATPNATPTEGHKVRVTASGSGMPEAATDFPLTVKAKK